MSRKKKDGMTKLHAFLKYNTVWSLKTLELFNTPNIFNLDKKSE
jgi:hypothetical protein